MQAGRKRAENDTDLGLRSVRTLRDIVRLGVESLLCLLHKEHLFLLKKERRVRSTQECF